MDFFYTDIYKHQLPAIAHTTSNKAPHSIIGESGINFSFGLEAPKDSVLISDAQEFSVNRGYGWVKNGDFFWRDRKKPNELLKGLLLSFSPATFRVILPTGNYRITFYVGDSHSSDHVTRIKVSGNEENLPVIADAVNVYSVLSTSIYCSDFLDICFDSPENNWIINRIEVKPEASYGSFSLKKLFFTESQWELPDPTERGCDALIRRVLKSNTFASATKYPAKELPYLNVIEPAADYFQTLQQENGAIVDPYRKEEFQYSTPCFAYIAALLAYNAGRSDLVISAKKAFEWSLNCLSQRKAASEHEDFYPSLLAHAFRYLAPLVKLEEARSWQNSLSQIDPFKIYRCEAGGNDGPGSNWNCKALAGEGLLSLSGLKDSLNYVEYCLSRQGRFFSNEYGMYAEGPMVYDIFPRAWLADLIEEGYNGVCSNELREALRRGALTSLLLQSPTGELPCGGRSAHHQWADALQCITFEIAALDATRSGDLVLAGCYKRAARLALLAILPWKRSSGEFWIVKNKADPSLMHGYESYSSHTQYGLLTLVALGYAYEYSIKSAPTYEYLAPSEVGGYVLSLPAPYHKIVAAAAGTYIIVCLKREANQTPAGLVRIHFSGLPSILGPSDGVLSDTAYLLPHSKRTNLSIGLSWNYNGTATSLADLMPEAVESKLSIIAETPEYTKFEIAYTLASPLKHLTEIYSLSQKELLVSYIVEWADDLFVQWPIFMGDGVAESKIIIRDKRLEVTFEEKTIMYEVQGCENIILDKEKISHRNGYVKLARAKAVGGKIPMLKVFHN